MARKKHPFFIIVYHVALRILKRHTRNINSIKTMNKTKYPNGYFFYVLIP